MLIVLIVSGWVCHSDRGLTQVTFSATNNNPHCDVQPHQFFCLQWRLFIESVIASGKLSSCSLFSCDRRQLAKGSEWVGPLKSCHNNCLLISRQLQSTSGSSEESKVSLEWLDFCYKSWHRQMHCLIMVRHAQLCTCALISLANHAKLTCVWCAIHTCTSMDYDWISVCPNLAVMIHCTIEQLSGLICPGQM